MNNEIGSKYDAPRLKFYKAFLENDVKIDQTDKEGFTAFLTLIAQDWETSVLLLQSGANVNHRSNSGQFALNTIFMQKSLEKLKKFVEVCNIHCKHRKLDIN